MNKHTQNQPINQPTKQPLGGSSRGQRSPGRLYILQEGNPEGTGAGHLYILKDKLTRKTSLTVQRVSSSTQEEREFMTCGRRGRPLRTTTDVVRLCSEKTRRAKAQL